jgi:hypothetical protein
VYNGDSDLAHPDIVDAAMYGVDDDDDDDAHHLSDSDLESDSELDSDAESGYTVMSLVTEPAAEQNPADPLELAARANANVAAANHARLLADPREETSPAHDLRGVAPAAHADLHYPPASDGFVFPKPAGDSPSTSASGSIPAPGPAAGQLHHPQAPHYR